MTAQIPTPPAPPGLDPTYVFSELMPLIAIVTLIIVGAIGLRWVFRTPVGEAIAHRIRHGKSPGHEFGATGDHAHTALEAQVSQLQDHVAEIAERLDFTERLLADSRERRVGPPKP